MKRFAAVAVMAVLCCAGLLAQESTEKGNRELGVWLSSGHSVPGGTTGTGVLDAGVRYGWVLTNPVGSGPLRGSFEYAVDAIPLYLVTKNGTTYGGGFNPLVLKWNFAGGHRAAPWIELAGGTLFSTREVPRFTSAVNFRSGAALGVHVFGSKIGSFFAVRYEHISNAGLSTPNPGINTVQFQVGIDRFKKK